MMYTFWNASTSRTSASKADCSDECDMVSMVQGLGNEVLSPKDQAMRNELTDLFQVGACQRMQVTQVDDTINEVRFCA